MWHLRVMMSRTVSIVVLVLLTAQIVADIDNTQQQQENANHDCPNDQNVGPLQAHFVALCRLIANTFYAPESMQLFRLRFSFGWMGWFTEFKNNHNIKKFADLLFIFHENRKENVREHWAQLSPFIWSKLKNAFTLLLLLKSFEFSRPNFLLRINFPQLTMKTIILYCSTEYALFCFNFPSICFFFLHPFVSLRCANVYDELMIGYMRRDALCQANFWAGVFVVWMWFFAWILVSARSESKRNLHADRTFHTPSHSQGCPVSRSLCTYVVRWAMSTNSFDSICIYKFYLRFTHKSPAIHISHSVPWWNETIELHSLKLFLDKIHIRLVADSLSLHYTFFDFAKCHIW